MEVLGHSLHKYSNIFEIMILKHKPKVSRNKLTETLNISFFNPFRVSPWKEQTGLSYNLQASNFFFCFT